MSIFREANNADGSKGPVSMRRVLAFIFSLFAICLFIVAFTYASVGWVVFIPGTICTVASLLLLFFTTWADVAAIINAVKG